ncbi:MAG: hypothetical protein AAF730_09055 [Bacteroidota bacterium]
MGWLDGPSWLERRRKQEVARNEVLEAFYTDPIAGYGLYHLLRDAGLLSAAAQDELQPLVANAAHRLTLDEAALRIQLPMQFEPLTDIEHDTLTYVIARAIEELLRDLPSTDAPLRLAELKGLNTTLERHRDDTASFTHELRLADVLAKLVRCCGTAIDFERADRSVNVEVGDFFVVTDLKQARRRFIKAFLDERNMDAAEVLQVVDVWPHGYLRVERFGKQVAYSQEWFFQRPYRALPKEPTQAVVHRREGQLYRLSPGYAEAVARFIALYQQHQADHSPDPTHYRPTGPTAAG